mmetsp:Transcript_25314/g.79944  ORF Transcript_25314/g.79944 Transcript_25314/m.79944 type:complete len:322 (-) Transcript_25314:448-1413(-)
MPSLSPSAGAASARAAPPTPSPSVSGAAAALGSTEECWAWPRVTRRGGSAEPGGGTMSSSEAHVPRSSPASSDQSRARSRGSGPSSARPRSTPVRTGWEEMGASAPSALHMRTRPSLPHESRQPAGPSASTCTGPACASRADATSWPVASSNACSAPEAEPTTTCPSRVKPTDSSAADRSRPGSASRVPCRPGSSAARYARANPLPTATTHASSWAAPPAVSPPSAAGTGGGSHGAQRRPKRRSRWVRTWQRATPLRQSHKTRRWSSSAPTDMRVEADGVKASSETQRWLHPVKTRGPWIGSQLPASHTQMVGLRVRPPSR